MIVFLNHGFLSDGVVSWSLTPMQFKAVRCESKIVATRVSGVDARQVNFSHLLSKRDSWEVVISADELIDSSKFDFLKALFVADAWNFGYEGQFTGANYIRVALTNEGNFPVSFIGDCVDLPEVKLNFIDLFPD
jgi:hypothetical protein